MMPATTDHETLNVLPREQSKLAYSIKEAAEVASLGRTTLYKLIADGLLPIVKIGNRTLILSDDLKQLMLNNRLN